MTKGIFTMSQKELDRIRTLEEIESKRLSQVQAASQLGLTTRHIRRLLNQYQAEGPEGLISKRRGKPSNNRLSEPLKLKAISLIQKHYYDFGPTLAHEKLTEKHELPLSVESVRRLMLKEGLWKSKKRKSTKPHPMRARRSQEGELVQIDGSPHDWFEGRAEPCCLIVFIDDATSKMKAGRFVEVESTQAYFDTMEWYLKQHGRPLGTYSDRHSIFRVNIPEAEGGRGETQFGRAMRELDIKLICAKSPQAKGRVEKANRTLQDRLVKEMRLRGISDIHSANAFLPEYMEDYNRRFGVEPSSKVDAHRREIPGEKELKLIFSQQHVRKISKNLEVSYQNVIYQIQTKTPGYCMRKAGVTVCDRGGEVTLYYKGKSLEYKRFEKGNRPAEIASSKEIEVIKRAQHKPGPDHPWRKGLSGKVSVFNSERKGVCG